MGRIRQRQLEGTYVYNYNAMHVDISGFINRIFVDNLEELLTLT